MAYPYYPNYGNWNMNNPVQPSFNPVTTPQNTDIPWVQGEADAKARPVMAGHSAMFMDSETTVFYIKTVDVSGIPQPLRIFDYKERVTSGTNRGQTEDKSGTETVTRQEFDALADKVDKLIKEEGEG